MRKSRTGAFESFFTFETRSPRSSSSDAVPQRKGARTELIELSSDVRRENAIIVSVLRNDRRRRLPSIELPPDPTFHEVGEQTYASEQLSGGNRPFDASPSTIGRATENADDSHAEADFWSEDDLPADDASANLSDVFENNSVSENDSESENSAFENLNPSKEWFHAEGTMDELSVTDHPELEELEGLAQAAGVCVVGKLVQYRDSPDPATYLGRGKVEDLRMLIDGGGATLVLFDNDLSPSQGRNLEKTLKVRVIDRTELILDIFATRARTSEAKLAVELAQLEYSLPRLKRLWTHLERQTKGGVGLRGPGEKQIETDRRLAEKRIADLKQQLTVVHNRRIREASARNDRMTVSLVGYTNAGKSTLMNLLTGANVQAEDALFCTLDTRTRRWSLPGWGPVLLSDTVGFIRDLPHHLIASFRATLEEAKQANLLLHVADASNPAVFDQISAAYAVLEELGIQSKDTILVLNKLDALRDPGRLEALKSRYPTAIGMSAKTRQGVAELIAQVSERLSSTFLELDVLARVDQGKLFHYLAQHGEVVSNRYQDETVWMHVRIAQKFLGWIRHEAIDVRPYHHPEWTIAEFLGEEDDG
ncbi:MAG: GTPase HflX [Thermoguttaceae bacterium]|nr:GTPase HflX [Thermoguttaceae bacterium]